MTLFVNYIYYNFAEKSLGLKYFKRSNHDNFNFYKFISEDEKRDIAKHILCFLYLLNKAHLKAYLIDKKAGDIQNVEDTIKKWLKDIPTNDKFES